jgi:protein-S-isoprenylcysteine O-methyltransferase Ste14
MISLISFDPTSFKVQLGPLVLLALRLSLLSPSLTTSLSIFSLSLYLRISVSFSLYAPLSISFSLSLSLRSRKKEEKDLLKRFTVHFNAYCQPLPVYAVSYRDKTYRRFADSYLQYCIHVR